MKTKFLAALLVVCMLLSLSTMAFAATTYEVGSGKTYATLQDAIDAIETDGVIDAEIRVYGKVEIDTAALKSGQKDFYTSLAIPSSIKTLKIVGESGAELSLKCLVDGKSNYGGIVARDTDVTFENLTISHDKTSDYYQNDYARRNSYWFVEGGDNNTVTYTNCTFPNPVLVTSKYTVIDGCTFNSTQSGMYALFANGRGTGSTLEVKDSMFTGLRAIKLYDEGNKAILNVTIEGNTFDNIEEKAAINVDKIASAIIKDNTFICCEKGLINEDSGNNTAYPTNEKIWEENGTSCDKLALTITGDLKVGSTLTASVQEEHDEGETIYNWYREESYENVVPVGTEKTYTITDADVGKTLYCLVENSENPMCTNGASVVIPSPATPVPVTPTPVAPTATATPAPAAPVAPTATPAPAPKTGDSTNLALWMGLMVISGVALLGLGKKAKAGK